MILYTFVSDDVVILLFWLVRVWHRFVGCFRCVEAIVVFGVRFSPTGPICTLVFRVDRLRSVLTQASINQSAHLAGGRPSNSRFPTHCCVDSLVKGVFYPQPPNVLGSCCPFDTKIALIPSFCVVCSDGEPQASQVHRLRQGDPLPEERAGGVL